MSGKLDWESAHKADVVRRQGAERAEADLLREPTWMSERQREEFADRGFSNDGPRARAITERDARHLLDALRVVPVTLTDIRRAAALPDFDVRRRRLTKLREAVVETWPAAKKMLDGLAGGRVLSVRSTTGALQSAPDRLIERVDTELTRVQPVSASGLSRLTKAEQERQLRAQFLGWSRKCRFCGTSLPVRPLPHLIVVVEDPGTGKLVQACQACCLRKGLARKGSFRVPQEYGQGHKKGKL